VKKKKPIKVRLYYLNRTQRDVIEELHRRGHRIDASDFGKAISGKISFPYTRKAITDADEIITAWEQERKRA
jgi:hypothetical protein